ncbi:hypothetical protein NEMBOFW57_000907 [Staphylotrichum longicolle]|uniref:V-type proton ATPase proteolipid subunit n=1 Tax=Staphylotrichum longicolle TaxID=669026 RepID=A0AAD4F3J9_9PEZI|nr:hypothetical protein NEMBOFW57_000907 [Staphylotrichum longicolle]
MDYVNLDRCPIYASFFGALGCACAIIFTVFGASYGTAKSAGAIFSSGVIRPDSLCAIMAQIISIYGLVASVIISNNLVEKMALHTAFLQLGAGLAVGCAVSLPGSRLASLVMLAPYTYLRASTQQPRLYVGMVLILIFAEVLGLYGVIVSILMLTRSTMGVTACPY